MWLRLAGVVLFLLLWTAIAYRVRLIPGPAEVIASACDLRSDHSRPCLTPSSLASISLSLLGHSAVSTVRIVVGFSLGAATGVVGAFILARYRRLYLLTIDAIESMRPVPPVALVPLFLLVFGISEYGRILLVLLGTGFVLIVATLEAIRLTPLALVDAHRSLGLSREELTLDVVVPSTLSQLLGPARIALALSCGLVVISEFMGSSVGLGYLIATARSNSNVALVMLCSVLIGSAASALDACLRAAHTLCTPWRASPHSTRPRFALAIFVTRPLVLLSQHVYNFFVRGT